MMEIIDCSSEAHIITYFIYSLSTCFNASLKLQKYTDNETHCVHSVSATSHTKMENLLFLASFNPHSPLKFSPTYVCGISGNFSARIQNKLEHEQSSAASLVFVIMAPLVVLAGNKWSFFLSFTCINKFFFLLEKHILESIYVSANTTRKI